MADIKESITYTGPQKALIAIKLEDASFTHKNWGDADLEELRKAIRDFYRQQQYGYCSFCKNPVSLQAVDNCHIEHIAPKSKYLQFIFEPKNLCVICAECNAIKRHQEIMNEEPDIIKNGAKRKRYPGMSKAFKIVHPHFDNYDEHIEIFGGYFYGGISDKGLYTILFCGLNRRLEKFGWRREYTDSSTMIGLAGRLLAAKSANSQRQVIEEMAKALLMRK